MTLAFYLPKTSSKQEVMKGIDHVAKNFHLILNRREMRTIPGLNADELNEAAKDVLSPEALTSMKIASRLQEQLRIPTVVEVFTYEDSSSEIGLHIEVAEQNSIPCIVVDLWTNPDFQLPAGFVSIFARDASKASELLDALRQYISSIKGEKPPGV